jgi:hypothetical protein
MEYDTPAEKTVYDDHDLLYAVSECGDTLYHQFVSFRQRVYEFVEISPLFQLFAGSVELYHLAFKGDTMLFDIG